MASLTVEVDPAVGAVYLRLSTALVARTIELPTGEHTVIMVDLDDHGRTVGVEMLP